MTREELFKIHQETCHVGLELMKKKNADYSKDGALGNFYVCETTQLCSAEVGILVRVSDKLSRLSSILQKGEAQVKDESSEDTIIDVINYMVLLRAVLQDKSRTPPAEFTKKEIREFGAVAKAPARFGEIQRGSCYYCVERHPERSPTKTGTILNDRFVCVEHLEVHNLEFYGGLNGQGDDV